MQPKELAVWKLLLTPIVLCFLLDSVYILNYTYADSLFLSSYPRHWLLYYYIADPIITILLFFFASPFLSRASSKHVGVFILGAIAVLLTLFLTKSQFYVLPFALSLALYACTKLLYPIGWNAIATSFDIRFFKKYTFYFSTASAVGSIATAFLIPVLIHFTNAYVLFFMGLAFIIGIAICLLYLRPLPVGYTAKSEKTIESNLFKNKFFIYLFIFTIVSLTVAALGQFSFQTALMEGDYSQEGLATFISIFNGSIAIVCLIIQAGLARRLLSWVGLMGVLLILPSACLIISLGLTIWPVFILFIVFNATQLLFGETFMYPCREIMINPYPTALRKKANMLIRGYATPIGGLIGALMVFLIQHSSLHLLGAIVMVFCMVLIYFTIRAAKEYQNTLYNSIKESRYAPDFLNLTPDSVLFMREHLLTSMKSSDTNAIRTALSFYQHEHFIHYVADNEIQKAIVGLLQHKDTDIRLSAIRAIKNLKIDDVVDMLLDSLEHECDARVNSELIDALCHFQPKLSFDKAMSYMASVNPFLMAYGIIVLERMPGSSAQALVEQKVQQLLKGPSFERVLLAKIERHLKAGMVQNGRLLELIKDPSDEVSIQALESLSEKVVVLYAPILLGFLNNVHRSYFAAKALQRNHDAILDYLLAIDPSMPVRQKNIMLRLLAHSKKIEALHKLIELSKTSHVSIRYTIAHFVARYAPYKESFKQERIDFLSYITEEITTLQQLNAQGDGNVAQEIKVQLRINRSVFLSWFGTLTNAQTIERIRQYIEKPEHYLVNDVSKAYELLDSLSNTPKLRDMVAKISQDYQQNMPIEAHQHINPNIMMLATHPFTYHEGIVMNTFDKMALLRQVTLFADIPLESLQALAEIATEKDMAEGEKIFSSGDETDGFYCIVSGEVVIKRDEIILSHLKAADYFGELGSFDNSPRTADALATSNGLLLYIDKEEFLHVLDDFPEVMRSIVAQVINYLRSNLDNLLPGTKN